MVSRPTLVSEQPLGASPDAAKSRLGNRFLRITLGLVLGSAGVAIAAHKAREALKPVQANKAFSEIGPFKAASRAELPLDELFKADYYRHNFEPYTHRPHDLTQALEHLPETGGESSTRFKSYRTIIATAKTTPDLAEKAIIINYWNHALIAFDAEKMDHAADYANWYRDAQESVAEGKAICTDQVLVNYEALRLAGFPEDRMAILLLGNRPQPGISGRAHNLYRFSKDLFHVHHASLNNEAHAVLLVKLEEGDYVLSNGRDPSLIEVNHFMATHQMQGYNVQTLPTAQPEHGLQPIMIVTLGDGKTTLYLDHSTRSSSQIDRAPTEISIASYKPTDTHLQQALSEIGKTKLQIEKLRASNSRTSPTNLAAFKK